MKWPVWMDEAGLMAKSEEMGGETLAEHTWQVLSRLGDLVGLHPNMPRLMNDERLWTRMYWACFLHDFGKAASEFQQVLQKQKNEWSEFKQRHEILSLAFVDWLFPRGHPDRIWIITVVAFHHKDANVIIDKYGGHLPFNMMDEAARSDVEEMLDHLAMQIKGETRQHLWRWTDECSTDWANALSIPLLGDVQLMTWDAASASKLKPAIFRALRDYHDWNQSLSEAQRICALLYRGLILTADHAASAGAEPFPPMRLTRAVAIRPLRAKGYEPRGHQLAAERCAPGSALLIAPTGSGKTEAALLWAAQQMAQRPAARLFYTLPYQASMNAMYQRLLTRFFGYSPEAVRRGQCPDVTIQHSRALLKLYQDYMAWDESTPAQARKSAKRLRNLAQLNYYPIQVFSPYQMLKAAYSLKGYEALLVDYAEALFIFDEIHAYDPKRLALIIRLMGWLQQHFAARFLVMTATLPPPVRNKLQQALQVHDEAIIQATPEEFARSQRHVVHLLTGRLEEEIVARVRADWQAGRKVLVCLNRVADAKRVFCTLRDALKLSPAREEIVLLHGRFNGEDRSQKEAILLGRAGVEQRSRDSAPFVAVATQAVEVSLDVDFDTLYTDPAPLEALLQRFGRVNRGRSRPAGAPPLLCPVHVFTQPNSLSNDPYLPYDQAIVQAGLQTLAAFCGGGRPVDEGLVTQMLAQIYQGETAAAWEREYAQQASEFQSAILDQMKPFHSADRELRAKFYKMFDGVEVLPVDCVEHYYDALESRGYLDASKYLVNISTKQYAEFHSYGMIIPAKELEGGYADHIKVPYDADFGLDLDGARADYRDRQAQDGILPEDEE